MINKNQDNYLKKELYELIRSDENILILFNLHLWTVFDIGTWKILKMNG